MLTIEHAHLKGWNNTWLESDFNFGGVGIQRPLNLRNVCAIAYF